MKVSDSVRCTLLATSCILALATAPAASAHSPHDPVWALAISPTFDQDRTLVVGQMGAREWRAMDIVVSRNAGATWALTPSGLDNNSGMTSCVATPASANQHAFFCTSFGDGVYRSLDGGRSWERSNAGLDSLRIMTSAAAVDAAGAAVLWVTSVEGLLYVSTDLGQSWRQVDVPMLVSAVAPSADYAIDATVLVGAPDGTTAASTQGGLDTGGQWAALGSIATGERVNTIVVPPGFSTGGEVFAGTTGGLYRSTDAGATYAIVPQVPAEHVQAIIASPAYAADGTVFAASANAGVFKSTDRGNAWTQYPTGIPYVDQSSVQHYTFAISSQFAVDRTVLIGTFGGLGLSTDGGATWVELDTRPPSLVMSLAVSPNLVLDATVVATAYTSGAYVSTSRGDDWRSANTGLGNFTVYDAAFTRYGWLPVLYAVQQSLVLRSFDAGKTWQWLSEDPLPGRRVFPSKLVLSPSFAQDFTMFMGSRGDGVLRSTDGGRTWVLVLATPDAFISALAVSPDFGADRTVFAAVTTGEIMRSTDGGGSWHSVWPDTPVKESGPYYLALAPDFRTRRLVLLGTPHGLYRSDDAGENWSLVAHPQVGIRPVHAVAISPRFAADGTALAVLRGKGLFRTRDSGSTWQEIAPDLDADAVQFNEIYFSPNYAIDRTVFGVSHDRIFRSNDAAATWQEIPLAVIRHEDARQSVELAGDWTTVPARAFSAATAVATIGAGASARIRFHGTGVSWIGLLGPSSGVADVYLDGVLVDSVDQFRPGTQVNATLFARDDLPPGPHELRIVPTGERNPLSASSVTLIDAVDVIRAIDSNAERLRIETSGADTP